MLGLLIALFGIAGFCWLGNRAYFRAPEWWQGQIPKPGDPSWSRYLAKEHEFDDPAELTLHDLYTLDFAAADANDTDSFYDHDVLRNAQGKYVAVEKAVLLDMGRGSKSVAFYIPYWDDTYGVAVAMASRVRPLLALWGAFVITEKPIGDADVVSSKDVPFSNRVYVYTEKELTAEEIGDLARIYESNGFKLLPRSQSYLSIEKMKFEQRR